MRSTKRKNSRVHPAARLRLVVGAGPFVAALPGFCRLASDMGFIVDLIALPGTEPWLGPLCFGRSAAGTQAGTQAWDSSLPAGAQPFRGAGIRQQAAKPLPAYDLQLWFSGFGFDALAAFADDSDSVADNEKTILIGVSRPDTDFFRHFSHSHGHSHGQSSLPPLFRRFPRGRAFSYIFPATSSAASTSDSAEAPTAEPSGTRGFAMPGSASFHHLESFLLELFSDCCRFLANRRVTPPTFQLSFTPPPEFFRDSTNLPAWTLDLADELRLTGFRTATPDTQAVSDLVVETYPGPWVKTSRGRRAPTLTSDIPSDIPSDSGHLAPGVLLVRTFSASTRAAAAAWQSAGKIAIIRDDAGNIELLTEHGPRLFPDLSRQSAVRRLAEYLQDTLAQRHP